MSTKISYYSFPVLLSVLIFSSNFLTVNLFDFGEHNFAVWFILSLFCFALGWIIDKTLEWRIGGRMIFVLTILTTIFSLFVVTYFSEYFSSTNAVSENLILYSLRNVFLGCMGFFGMSVAEVFILERKVETCEGKVQTYKNFENTINKEYDLKIKEAELKAKEILSKAEQRVSELNAIKENLESKIKEIIRTEKELIKKYENLE